MKLSASISKQLRTMALSSVIALVLIGAVGFFSIKSVTSEIELTSRRITRSLWLLSEIESRFLQIRINGLYHLSYASFPSKNRHEQNIRQLTDDIQNYFAEYETVAVDAQEKNFLTEDKRLFSVYLRALNRMLERSRANDHAAASKIVETEWKPAGEKLTRAFAEHKKFDAELISQIADKAVGKGLDNAILVVVLTIVGTLLLGSIQRRQMLIALQRHEDNLQQIAYHDALTGLPNRVLLADRLRQGIAHADRSGELLAVAYLDLDNFKPINDAYGHAVGDRVLIEVATRMHNKLRAGDTVARIGGDEFVILLMGQSNVYETEHGLQRFLHAICEPLEIDGHSFKLTASIGICLYPLDDVDPDILLRNADQTMYVAKRSGRNQYVFFGQEQREKNRQRRGSAHELRQALEQGQITVHYQPILDLASGRIVKAEALARWMHPQHGMIPPAEFIPMAEETGLINELGDHVFELALRMALEWNRRCPPAAAGRDLHRISINRSPRQFFTSGGLEPWVTHMRKLQVSGNMLSIEITEGLLLDDRPEVMEQLRQIRQLGISLSLDDFGTGYAALSYLKKFNIDNLKIDRSFAMDIAKDEDDRAIVESIIVMARRLGIETIAEGVETPAQAALLVAAGCDMAQGYLFSRPLPADEFIAFVLSAQSADPPRTAEQAHPRRRIM